jgi:hypothetical protein
MLCQNLACRKEIDNDATFCYFCGSSQSEEQETVVSGSVQKNDGPSQAAKARKVETQPQDIKFIEFRASENIWNYTEPEFPMQPEQNRPVLILDEEIILLSETHKHLAPEELLTRVQSIIAEKEVPVEAVLTKARWINDYYEVRPRIITSLKNHAYSGIKMILGLDYMGNWATLQFQIGIQPDPMPKPPPAVMSANQGPVLLVIGGIIGGLIGLMMTAAGANARDGGGITGVGILLILGGIVGVICGLVMLNNIQETIDVQRKEREKYEKEQYNRALYKARMALSRTYKIDDATLFREAMDKVFRQVVDDVIEQGGGKVVREIKGGENTLFDIQSNTPHGSTLQASSLAQKPLGNQVKTAATHVVKKTIKDELGIDV